MVFNSIAFLLFFTVVFFLFYYLPPLGRKVLLFIASSFFYMWFVPSYILVLYATILIDYFAALNIASSTSKATRKKHLLLGILNTCLVLFVFKYYNFFIENFNTLGFGTIANWHIILPIGLSFHVFQSLSYVIEVYRGNQVAEKNLLTYSNFVLFFPQLVAGPIERASNLLPQLRSCQHTISYNDFSIGFNRTIWGLFKKVVVADNISMYVDATYTNYQYHDGSTLLLSTFLFAIQIYADFSGYSDMAIGIARMLGFHFKENFTLPYFSKSITEFWRRWHISLSSWLRDYLYFSFGGNKLGKWKTYRNLMLTMLIGGLWHGASWNFVLWGGLNGVYLAIEKWCNVSLVPTKNWLLKIVRVAYVFILISFTWIFFRATTFTQAIAIIKKIATQFHIGAVDILHQGTFTTIAFSLLLMLTVEFCFWRKNTLENYFGKKNGDYILTAFSILFICLFIVLGNATGNQFIYFQF